MKNWKRTLFIAAIWAFILFYWWIDGFFTANWDFRMFNKGDWLYIYDEFQKGWVIQGFGDVLFMTVLIAMFPVYFIVLNKLLKIKWIETTKKQLKKVKSTVFGAKKQSSKKVKVNQANSKNTRPKAMESSIARPVNKDIENKTSVSEEELQAMQPHQKSQNAQKPVFDFDDEDGFDFEKFKREMAEYSVPKNSPFSDDFSPKNSFEKGFSIAPNPLNKQMFEDIDLDDIQLPERIKLDENITDLFENAGYTVLENVQIDKALIHYVALGENNIVVALCDDKAGDWLADEERFNNEDPLWFSESSHRISPMFVLLQACEKFGALVQSVGYEGKITPMLIEKTGTIINADDMKSTWDDLSVTVCRTDMGGPDELKSVANSIMPDSALSDDMITQIRQVIGV